MPEIHAQGLVKKRTLTEAETTAVEQLITTCNNYEGLHMRIDVGALRQTDGNGPRFATSTMSFSTEKRVGGTAWAARRDEFIAPRVKSGRMFNGLRCIRRQSARRTLRRSARNPAHDEILNPGLRFPQGSNINATASLAANRRQRVSGDFSCGKAVVFWGGCGSGAKEIIP